MKTILFSIILMSFVTASADVKITLNSKASNPEASGKTINYFSKHGTRYEFKPKEGGTNSLAIYNAKKNKYYILDTEDKRYEEAGSYFRRLEASPSGKMIGDTLKNALAGFLGDLKFVKKTKMKGIPCQIYKNKSGRFCIANPSAVGMNKAEADSYLKSLTAIQKAAFEDVGKVKNLGFPIYSKVIVSMKDMMSNMPGVPAGMDMSKIPGMAAMMKDIETKTLFSSKKKLKASSARFSIPKGYKKGLKIKGE